ncbi:HD-GYP domain-containing protein [Shewanella aestuarii]|uniref:DUF3391 domain-containing protein n=1 Tax=Shewanella aestuarii TaxID=1028752 RepID=A0A6G9QJJ2_9GAMM|nr:HD-GYP domain-containing protein [Shewanella aestuarii]QIR14235.1 DUF3391 domain-containing protein [Shewanella aestuarii]
MAKTELTQIPVSQMVLGLTVKLPLSWNKHPFLINKIKLEQQAQIELIKGLDVSFVYVLAGHDLLLPIDEVEQPQVEENQQEQQQDFKGEARKTMRLGQQRFVKAINDSRSIFGKVVSDPEGCYREVATLVEDLVDHLYEVENPCLTIVTNGDNDISVTQHGISVAVISMMIAYAYGLDKKQIRDISLGSIFHDIGKLKVPDSIRRKRGELTEQEANFLKMHPNFGFDMLNRVNLFPEAMLDIVLHHHEYIDGSGFPDGLTAKKIPITTQIVSLANDFDDLLQKYHSPQIALGTLFKLHSEKHTEQLIAILVKVLGIYPPGTLVRLSDGTIGKVMMTTKDVKQPHVWTCNESGAQASLRFLVDETIEIVEVIKLDSLTDGAIKTLQAKSPISFYFSRFSN